MNALERARAYYWDAYVVDRQNYWVLVQFLSLTLVLQGAGRLPANAGVPEQAATALWTLADVQSLTDVRSANRDERIWAAGNLVELYLLVPLIPGHPLAPDLAQLTNRAVEQAANLVATAGSESFGVFSTRRQIARYLERYNELAPAFGQVMGIAEAVFAQLPECDEPEWDY